MHIDVIEYLLRKALRSVLHRRNKRTAKGCPITLQNLCIEAKINIQNVYRYNYYFDDLYAEIKNKEMERKKEMLFSILNFYTRNIHIALKDPKFKFTVKTMLNLANLTKDQYQAITLPMEDFKIGVKSAQKKLTELRAKLERKAFV